MQFRITKVLGSISLLLGIFFLLNAFTPMTGFVIAENMKKAVSSLAGIIFIAAGIALLSYRESHEYDARESRLRNLIGERRYESLSERERIALNKTYRRHLEAEERRAYKGPSELAHHEPEHPLRIIRTEHFERAIRGHDEAAIERAIRKIGTGLGKEEKKS